MEVPVKSAHLLRLATLAILAGCTTQPAKNLTASNVTAPGKDVQCHQELQTGTMIGRTVCTTEAQRDDQEAAVTELRRKVDAPVGCSPQVCVR